MIIEKIVVILAIGGVLLLKYVVRSLSVGKPNENGPVLGDAFPTIEVMQPEEPVTVNRPEQMRSAMPSTAKVVSKSKSQLIGNVGRPSNPTAVPQSASSDEKKEKHGKLVALNSKSETKRAFIYSEIFNRKY